jgi:hypothetical protein
MGRKPTWAAGRPFSAENPLEIGKQEAFAREIAKFKSLSEAMRIAGYSSKSDPKRLAALPQIKARVEYLQRVSGVTASIDSAYVQRKLVDLVEAGISKDDIKPADHIRAIEMICKVNGLFAPTKVAPTNPEGTEPWNGAVTDTDRVKALEVFLARIKLKIEGA